MSGIGYLGCIRDCDDPRDKKKVYDKIPSSPQHDLRQYVTGIYAQGDLRSCTANAVCAAYRMDLKKESMTGGSGVDPVFDPSRLFLYYNTRRIEGHVLKDSGASIRDTVKSINAVGVCKEVTWPYLETLFNQKPPPTAYKEANGNIVYIYEQLDLDVNQFRACLKDNCPFVFGFNVFESFGDTRSNGGRMPLPETNEAKVGEHAVVAVGYDDRSRHFTILNSGGEDWGDKGYFYMPYEFISNPKWCHDFWKITFVKQRFPLPVV
jgi:C1A family cysteine protease